MAGRAVSRAKYDAELQRAEQAAQLPTAPRSEPLEYSPAIIPELYALADCGLAPAEIAAHWSIAEEDLKAWREAHPEFRAAFAHARTKSKAWWERSARIAMAKGDTRFPAGLWSHVMRARYAEYDDKAQVTVNIDLSRLVVVDATPKVGERGADPLLPGQTAEGANPLIINGTARLVEGQTLGPTSEGDGSAPPAPGVAGDE